MSPWTLVHLPAILTLRLGLPSSSVSRANPAATPPLPQGDKNWWAPLRIGYAAVKQGYDFASRLLSRERHEVASEASLP